MKNVVVLLLISFVFISVHAAGADDALKQFMPSEKIPEGWQLAGEVKECTPANVEEFAGAAAEKLTKYRFVKGCVAVYQPIENATESISASIADMGTFERAFGIYATSRGLLDTYGLIGAQSLHRERSVELWLKNFYVHISATEKGHQDDMLSMAREIVAKIVAEVGAAESRFPDILKHMTPTPGDWTYRKHSLRLIPENHFGTDFLDWVYTADYLQGDEAVTFCILKRDTDKEAEDLFEKCKKNFEDVGDTVTITDLGRRSLISRGPSLSHWVVLQDNLLFAVSGFKDPEKVKSILVDTLKVNGVDPEKKDE